MTLKGFVKSFYKATSSTYFLCGRHKLFNVVICRDVSVQRPCLPNRTPFVSPIPSSLVERRTLAVASSSSELHSEQNEEEDIDEEEEDWDDVQTSFDADNNIVLLSGDARKDRNVVRAVQQKLLSYNAGKDVMRQRRLTDEECAQLRRDVLYVLQTGQLPPMTAGGTLSGRESDSSSSSATTADLTPQLAAAGADLAASPGSRSFATTSVVHRTCDGRLLKVLRVLEAYGVAFSYLEFLRSRHLFNVATAVLACELIYKAAIYKLATQQDVADLIEYIEQRFPFTFSVSSIHKLYCLAATSKYKNAVEELKAEGLNFDSPTRHLILTSACFEHNDSRAAFDLLGALARNRRVFVDERSHDFKDMCSSACVFFARRAKSHPDMTLALFHKFLSMMQTLKISGLPFKIEPSVRDMFASISPTMTTNLAQIDSTGKCSGCSMLMPKEELNSKEFEDMKKFVMQELMHGKDVFRSSTPNEMRRFIQQVANSAPYDIVFDALNVAFHGAVRLFDDASRAQYLIGVINGFKKHLGCKTVCVVTRRHLLRNTPQQLAYLKKWTSLVLLDDSTVDDPFVLYSALASGPGCYVVSKDRYGFLCYALDFRVQSLFKRWLRTRLVSDWRLSVDGKLNMPESHALSSHVDQDGCHIPLMPKSSKQLNVPVQWICVRRSKESR